MRFDKAYCLSHEEAWIWTNAGSTGADGEETSRAKKLCDTKCSVRELCESEAKRLLGEGVEIRGVWGGKTIGTLRKELRNADGKTGSSGGDGLLEEAV